ncbi:alpha/beta fold hydrolase [Fibrella sp. WM1]|uniref:alpha/beta fold hydrolase n=1 Tax=Fibrella musci TaxID=3242485 RepID=UPI00351FB273
MSSSTSSQTASSPTPEWVFIAITALPLLYLAAIYTQFPANVPTHFGPTGQPDGYSSKEGLAIGYVLGMGLLYGLLRVLPAIDPTGRLTPAIYGPMRLTINLFLAGIATVILYIIHTQQTGSAVINLILSTVFLLFAGIGNVMLNVPRNYVVGIRTPWTLNSDTNWRKTHRLAGKLWVAGGLLAFVINFFLPTSLKIALAIAVPMVLAIIPFVYSYRLFKQGLCVALLLMVGAGRTFAQTEEPVRYVVTQPAGVSVTLDGTLTLPANATQPLPVVLLIAGSGPTDRNGNAPGANLNMYRQLADSLTKRGVAVLRYDKRLSGTNSFVAATQLIKPGLSFDYVVSDAVGFIRQLQADKRFSRVIVAGHSEGSLVGMLAAAQTNVDRFVSIAGAGQNIADVLKTQFADAGISGDNLALAQRDLDSLRAGQRVQKPVAPLASLFSPVNQPYLISWMRYDPARSLQAYKGRVLLIQGRHDIQVPVSEVERLKTARPDAQLLLIDGMNHVLKAGPADRAGNIASYTAPNSTILPAVADAIATFVK